MPHLVTLQRIQHPAFALRVCPDADESDPTPDFVASGVLEIDAADPRVGRLLAFKADRGGLTLGLQKALLSKLRSLGLETLISYRKEGHRLPCSTLREDGYLSTDLVRLAARTLP